MPDHVYRLRVTYSSSPSNSHNTMVGDWTVDANKRPVRTISNLLSPNDSHATVDFPIV
jgi:hypothetical protein